MLHLQTMATLASKQWLTIEEDGRQELSSQFRCTTTFVTSYPRSPVDSMLHPLAGRPPSLCRGGGQ